MRNTMNIDDMANEIWNFIDTHNIHAMSMDDVEHELDKIEQKYREQKNEA